MAGLEAWHDLYVMTGGAAAALIGLLFVAVALHTRVLVQERLRHVRALAVHVLVNYLVLLLLSFCLLIPDQTGPLLGAELAALGVTILGVLAVLIRAVASTGANPGPRWHEWLRTFVASGLTAVGLIAAGVAVGRGAAVLDWLPLIAVALLLIAVLTSWDLLLKIPSDRE